MKIVIMRHGKTEGNKLRKYIGRTDDPLSEEGFEEVRRAGVCPGQDRVYVSPLSRARQTAKLCFPGATRIVCKDFQEIDFGAFDGKSHNENMFDSRYRDWLSSLCESGCPEGESRQEFIGRTKAEFLRRVCDEAIRGSDRMIVVAHGGTIMALMTALSASTVRTYHDWYVQNCEGYCIDLRLLKDGDPQIVSFFKFCHMDEVSAFLRQEESAQ